MTADAPRAQASPATPASLDRLAQEFEAAWRAGNWPSLEVFLQRVPAADRARGLLQLLRIELSCRSQRGEQPTLEEYRQRFPADEALILTAFLGMPTTPPPAEPGPASTVPRPSAPPTSRAGWPAVPGYQIDAALAPGGMGVVYRARQVGLNRLVALKMIRSGLHAEAQERARFRLEAEAVASLSHPNIIPIFDCGEWQGMPYLAMEYAEGGSLAQRLTKGPVPVPEIVEIMETLAQAVQFVHDHGLVHRDLKPANILRTAAGVFKLADFGLAKRLDEDSGLTATRAVLGTASYMAPEQAAGDRAALGPGTDIYGLGAVLYELLTGRPPFEAETREQTIQQVLTAEPIPPSQIRPDTPRDLEALCLKCLEKEPARRFASARALAEDLRRYGRGEKLSIPSFGPLDWHARLARRAGYEIQDLLGASATGIVYLARHVPLNRLVCIEMIALREPKDPERLARIRTEVVAAAQLHHPNIVEVYDFGELGGEPFLTREYVEGTTLAERPEGPPLSFEQTASLVETLARAVHTAHQGGLIHGALKPSRVLVTPDGTPKIIGFGRTLLGRESSPADTAERPWLPLSGSLAPEQLTGPTEARESTTDVYALGSILYELLTGRPPILAETVQETLAHIRAGNVEPPRRWRPEVPRELERICLHCLEQDPARRYPSAAALAEDLRRYRSGEVLFIDDLDDWTQQERWARRAGYAILELLGQGRDGFTYKARQVTLGRIVILRRISAQDRFVPLAKERFRWEAQMLARCRHPNVVQLFDHGEQNDLPYFAREFVDGPSLAEKLSQSPFGARMVARLVDVLAKTLQALHSRGIILGNLHPDHIYLTTSGLPKISAVKRQPLPVPGVPLDGPENRWCRRLAYLAPEQLERRRGSLTPQTDVYALGALLYTLLSGQPPFRGDHIETLLNDVRTAAPPPPSDSDRGVMPELASLCMQCLEKDPQRRPASAEAVLLKLRDGWKRPASDA